MVKNKDSFRIAFTYIGAIVGAGFATGQEIHQFFAVFQVKGIVGSLVATFGFILFSSLYLNMVFYNPIYSYRDLLIMLVGKKMAKLFDLSISFFLFGSYTIMLAAGHTLVTTHVIPSYHISYLLVISIVWLSLINGVKGVIKINTYLIPVLVIVITILCIFNLSNSAAVFVSGLVPQNYLFSSITYVSYNLIIGMVVLSALKEEIYTKKVIILAPIISGVVLGAMLMLVTVAIGQVKNPSEIPILDLALGLDRWFRSLLILGIGIAILTSALASGYGLVNRLRQNMSINYKNCVAIVTVLAVPLSLYGFTSLIKIIYPLFGFLNLFLMISTIRFFIVHRFKAFYKKR